LRRKRKGKKMAGNGKNESSTSGAATSDRVHPRSRLSSSDREKEYLWHLHSDGATLSRNCISQLLDAVKVLYGSVIADKAEVEFAPLLHDERALKNAGLMISLQTDYPLSTAGNLCLLQLAGVDLLSIVDNHEFDRSGLDVCWSKHNGNVETALDEVQFLVGVVHGPFVERDFLVLYQEVASWHESALEAVIAILSNCYGHYPTWGKGLSTLRELRATRPAIDWGELLQLNM
jgi:hypothetical protein